MERFVAGYREIYVGHVIVETHDVTTRPISLDEFPLLHETQDPDANLAEGRGIQVPNEFIELFGDDIDVYELRRDSNPSQHLESLRAIQPTSPLRGNAYHAHPALHN